ncbi:30S ribosomal protein S4 [Neobittarella massiliensis]|uniref:Small ribosomal subunit protein uS4 n=2 Tax=Oscillospiraceae TaxID=216572 RepID=A0A8J6ILJ6_9FIRM|nr:30S ribosomal protein S4 [Neobittarella massiliensis]MBC3514870.1 30S ribosomal protein S4 [Neobittarella massiliensis]SCJ70426.1 30S ribosomal protein S4 [uncultured Anaerotruncus sp.]
MARYTGAVCRQCRREGQKLFLKGERCYSDKCAIARRAYAPGQHGQGRKKVSEYGLQMREKQKARRYYGILEGQFAGYYEMAVKSPEVTGTALLKICESRLDNIAYRAGFASSRKEARQLVLHRHFTVNGKRVNIPSYRVKAGDVVAVFDGSKNSTKIKEVAEQNASRPSPVWMDVDRENLKATITRLPNREDIDFEVEEQLIVEYYSK